MRYLMCYTILFLLVTGAYGQNWPRFRGPNGSGISEAKGIPIRWTDSDYRWKAKLPGQGHSSPAVWKEKLFITCGNKNDVSLLAMDANRGNILWEKDYTLAPYRMNSLNHYAAASPACDERAVYAIWSTAEETSVLALDHSGTSLWSKSFGSTFSQHGPCKTPMLVDDLVVFTMEQRANSKDVKSCWYALDKNTGSIRWQLQRDYASHISYSTPCVYTTSEGRNQIVFSSKSHGITGVDPLSGKVLWEEMTACPARVVASPIVVGDLVIANCGDAGTGMQLTALIPPKDAGAQPTIAYTLTDRKILPYVTMPLVVGDLMFTFHDTGPVCCFDAKTGQTIWTEKPGGRFYCSPVYVDGNIYCVTMDGKVVVIKASREYRLLAVNDLGEQTQASPAVADNRLYLRTLTQVFCVGPKP
ncbi:MAG: PQQ-binding-like beta-propeller repeat protein [Sedimentisphaerales bacterium]|nr:PQQ-binding-like beta-propeller repeat protein [Sedimentisphaerales bacterium]